MESLHSQGYHFGFSEDMQHQQMIEKSLRIINPFIGTNESSDSPIEKLNAQLVSLVGGNGAQLLDWCSKK